MCPFCDHDFCIVVQDYQWFKVWGENWNTEKWNAHMIHQSIVKAIKCEDTPQYVLVEAVVNAKSVQEIEYCVVQIHDVKVAMWHQVLGHAKTIESHFMCNWTVCRL